MTTALLIATTEAGTQHAAVSPSAMLPLHTGTVLERLRDQLASLGVRRQYVLLRPHHTGWLRRTAGVEVCESAGPYDDFRNVGRLVRAAARAERETVVVLPADLVCHREAIAGLLDDPRVSPAALVSATSPPASRPAPPAPPVRVEHQRVVSAGSAYHRVSGANACFLGVLRAGPDDLGALARAADGLASLADSERLDDVPALLLVALARSHGRVGAVDVRELRCRRVATGSGAAAAESALGEVDEDRVLLDSSVKADDGLFATYCVSPYSRYVARWAARHRLTPNVVTTLSLGIGAGAAACFAQGTRPWLIGGAVLVQVAFVADCVDGQLARYTRAFSVFGGWLDAIADRAKEYGAYAGLAVGAVAAGGGSVWSLAVAALVVQSVRHMVDFGYAGAHAENVAALPRRPLGDRDDGLGAHVVPQEGAGGQPPPRPRRRPGRFGNLPGAATRLSRRLEWRPASRWLKKVIVLPIGERFALISLTAAVAGPRATFVALLAWGGLAGLYTLAGRVLRSLARGRPGVAEGAR